MMEFIERSLVLSTAGWFLLIGLGLCSFVLISQMLEDFGLAVLGSPVLMLGAAIGNQTFRELGIPLSSDKIVSMGIGFMIGLIVSSIFLVGTLITINTIRGR